jgi:hypothetical protein
MKDCKDCIAGVAHQCLVPLNPEDTKALKVNSAVGMLVTDDEIKAKRALNFLQGRLGALALGWFYKEGFYNVLVIGSPDDYMFMGGEEGFHDLKGMVDTIVSTDLRHQNMRPIEAYQEVSL